MPASAPQGFRAATKRKQKVERPVAEFYHEWTTDVEEDSDEEVVVIKRTDFRLTQPSDEQMFMIMAMVGDEDSMAASATAMMDILRLSLPPAEFRELKARLADEEDPLDMEFLSWMVERAMERWSDFPTVPSSASSQSPTSSGTKSTGRVRGKGSTHSASPSTAS